MNRVDRLMAIVVFLQGRRVVRAEELSAHFEISVRTVYRDIAALAEAGIPVVGEAGVGYSLVKGYHLPPVMFTVEEASALSIAGKLVNDLTDASLRRQMESALMKIRSILPRDRQDHLDRLDRAIAVLPRYGGDAPQLSKETLIPIQRALAERRVLRLNYRGAQRREPTARDVEPLGLIYYADHWHLVAHCRLRKDVRDFRTDRILQLELSPESFLGHTEFSLKAFLEERRCDAEFEMARVRFQAEAMDRVRREHYWGLVEEAAGPEGVEVTLIDFSMDRLATWVLSFATSAEVLEPEGLRERVVEEAARVVSRFGQSLLT